MTRRLIAVAALAAMVLGVVAGTGSGHLPSATSPCPGSGAVQAMGNWIVIQKPEELERVTTHATGGLDGRVILASDGKRVMRSGDFGCTWEQVWAIETADLPVEGRGTPRVSTVYFPGGRATQPVLLVDGIGEALGSRLMVSDDGGRTFEQGGEGLPLVLRYRDVLGDDPLYVTTSPPDEAGDLDAGDTGGLYVSEDGGRTFEPRGAGRPIVSASVASDPRTLYVVRSDHTVQATADAGQTWTDIPTPDRTPNAAETVDDPTSLARPANPWRWVAVRDGPAGRSVAVAASATRESELSRLVVSNAGGPFADMPVNETMPIGGITFANATNQLLVAFGSESSAHRGPGLVVYDVDAADLRDVDDRELASLFEPRLYPLDPATRGHAGYVGIELRAHRHETYGKPDVIARYVPPDPPPLPATPGKPCSEVLAGAPAPQPPEETGRAKPGEALVKPDPFTIKLEPGKPRRARMDLEVGAEPAPLDLGFLIDSTESMDPAIDGVFCSIERIARRLKEKGVDARLGLARYTDRTDRYERLHDMTPEIEPLKKQLENLFTKRGQEEPIRTGLYQAATGAGLDVMETPGEDDPPTAERTERVQVPPGSGMTFREGVERMLMVIGDEPYDETTDGEPSVAQVTAALRERKIKALGIHMTHPGVSGVLGDGGMNPPRPQQLRLQLDTFARESGALTPPGGVDCDGGGSPDLAEGAPLVCPVPAGSARDNIGDVILGLVLGPEKRADIRVVPGRTNGLDVKTDGLVLEKANVRRRNQLSGAAIVTCTEEQAGRRHPIDFEVYIGDKKVSTVAGVATCGTLPGLAPSKAEPRQASPSQPDQQPVQKEPASPAAPGQGSPQAPSPNTAPSPSPSPAASPQGGPQPAAAAAPSTPPPTPAPINSPSPASSPSASPSSAAASASSPAASAAVTPAPGAALNEERRSPGPQIAYADSGGSEQAMVGRRPRRGGDLAMVAVRQRSRARDRSVIPVPAAITLGVGVCGAAGWLVVGAGRRRRGPAVARVRR